MQDELFIDTNVFLRFLVFDKTNPKLSESAKQVFSKLQEEEVTLQTNALIIAEVIYVLERYYGLSKGKIKQILLPILSTRKLVIKEKEQVLAALTIFDEKNVDFEDAYTYFDMISSDISKIITFDERHFKRFDNIEIVLNATIQA